MTPEPLNIIFSEHALSRLKERLPDGHGLVKGAFVHLILVRHHNQKRNEQWMLRVSNGILLGKVSRNRKGTYRFIVRTALDADSVRIRQRKTDRQFVPLEVQVLQINGIRIVGA
jgi:hypothetical protein